MLRLTNRFAELKREYGACFISTLSLLHVWFASPYPQFVVQREQARLIRSAGDNSRIKEDWVQAKRHVLAVLRVQTGRTLFDVLTSRPEEVHELRWIEEVHRDIALETARRGRERLPPTPVEAEYQIESIRS